MHFRSIDGYPFEQDLARQTRWRMATMRQAAACPAPAVNVADISAGQRWRPPPLEIPVTMLMVVTRMINPNRWDDSADCPRERGANKPGSAVVLGC